jgi:3-isopropylmalate/(R)-2-methylmalate dehydratase large subunit
MKIERKIVMGMTMTQKILAAHAGLSEVKAGQLIEANLDLVLGNDVTCPVAINVFEENGADSVFDNTKIAMIMDHFTPNKDIKAAEQVKISRQFADKYDIKNYRDVGQMGIEHALLPEIGLVGPGSLCIGADSHTCTYGALGAFSTGVGSTDMCAGMISGKAWFKVPSAIKFELVGEPQGYVSGKDVILHIIGMIGVDGALYKSMEFCGEGIKHLNMDDRLCIANMAIEAGAKNGIFPVDDITREYCDGRFQGTPVEYTADEDAEYDETYVIDLSTLRPTVAFPHLPENTKTVDEIGETEVKIDQCVIGSCTNGRLSDLRAAANVLKGKKIAKGVRCIIFPGTQQIWKDAMHEGLFDIFIDAGAVVSTPTCGPCLGGHMGILAAGEKAISTTNRNFVGRMGHVDSEVYLASPAVAAASAVKGYITDPEKL